MNITHMMPNDQENHITTDDWHVNDNLVNSGILI